MRLSRDCTAVKGCLLLPLLLLGTVSALSLEKDAPHRGDPETQADLSRDPEGSGVQEGELALRGGVLESGGEEAEDARGDEGASDPGDLDEDVQCPKEEETVRLAGGPECKSCRYLMVQTPNIFRKAQSIYKTFRWTNGSRWNFGYWARGQPGNGRGHCVALCTRGGHWQRAPCTRQLPFICSY